MARFAPALLLALSAAWCGTLAGGATFPGSASFALSLLGVLAWIGTPWRDPLGLGRTGRWLPVALWAWAAVSAAVSPVPRAGLVGILLLPAFFALPGAVARCWREEASRREGLRAVSAVVAGCALWALLDRFLLGAPRAAMPLGHHNFLALWLAALLPLAVLPAREQGSWRWLGTGAGLLAILAVLASRSLMGTAAVAASGVLWLLFSPRPLAGPRDGINRPGVRAGRRSGLVLAAVVVLAVLAALQAPRLLGILSGHDLSARARAAYFEAGVEGFLARPLLGQGPGAAAWTASLFLDPAPGVNPWGETVGELHSLPLQLAYELGAPGLLLALATAGLFAVRRWGERCGAVDPGLLRAGLCGLVGGAVAFLGTASVAVPALPLALAVAAGAALTGGGDCGRSVGSVRSDRSVRWLYPVLAALALAPFLGAQALYDRALAADQAGERAVARQRLEMAVRLDPAFPLYRLRLALLQGTGSTERSVAAELARRAAEDGQGLAAFWTVAGILGQAAQRPWAPAALQTACALDPLSPFPPWFGMLTDPASPRAARQGAHALLAEPRLAAALFWRRHPGLFAGSLGEVQAWPGIDAVWTQALLDAAPSQPAGERRWLELALDVDPSSSISLFAFRRRPWPAQWPVVPLAGGPLEKLGRVGPATSRPGIPAAAFTPSICAAEAAQRSTEGRMMPTR